MAGGGSHNKHDGNRYEGCGAEVDELLVLGKLFEALVENRNNRLRRVNIQRAALATGNALGNLREFL
jgi:hypothetical protein